jgi:Tol biopolymer transport system component
VAEGRRLVIRPLDGSAVTTIDLPHVAQDPTFSPDGARIAYTADYQVHTVATSGTGPIRQATATRTVNGEAAWAGAGDWIVFRSNRSGAGDLYAVRGSASGGDEAGLAQVTATPEREVTPGF